VQAVNVTGGRFPVTAETVFAPEPAPSVQLPTVAMPDASVVALPPVTVPPPLVTVNVTGAPANGLPLASLTRTDGSSVSCVPGGAVTVVDEFAVIFAGCLPGPEASPPPQDIWSNRSPTGGSEEAIVRSSFIVANISEGKGACKNIIKPFTVQGERFTVR